MIVPEKRGGEKATGGEKNEGVLGKKKKEARV